MTAKRHILVVEDEPDVRMLLESALMKEGYDVTTAMAGDEALKIAVAETPDLILLDLMLPGMSGLDVCRRLKKNPKTEWIPVVMLTAKGEESDVVVGFEVGAEEYVTKPFSTKILMARIRSILRRGTSEADEADGGSVETAVIGGIVIHAGRREVFVDGEPVSLTLTEFKILTMLAGKSGWVFSRRRLIDGLGSDDPVTDRSIDVQIVALRKKLGSAGKLIETVRGVGYRLKG